MIQVGQGPAEPSMSILYRVTIGVLHTTFSFILLSYDEAEEVSQV